MAIFLNLIFNEFKRVRPRNDAQVIETAPERVVSEEVIHGLVEGDRFVAGKLIDADGSEVQIERVEDSK